jgi:hypothetical protein
MPIDKELSSAFKINVRYQNDAHPPQKIAVGKTSKIKTARDAEAHCLKVLRHKDRSTFEVFPCVEAKAERDEAFPIDEAPQVRSIMSSPEAS